MSITKSRTTKQVNISDIATVSTVNVENAITTSESSQLTSITKVLNKLATVQDTYTIKKYNKVIERLQKII
jgi:hypothetical protein